YTAAISRIYEMVIERAPTVDRGSEIAAHAPWQMDGPGPRDISTADAERATATDIEFPMPGRARESLGQELEQVSDSPSS
ncbi:hypothetical protein, partial [Escherichia coli]|uniref:hypothetical protein n=1 Tax=Escherichia coli TaxID=562 RepID=UPI0019533189